MSIATFLSKADLFIIFIGIFFLSVGICLILIDIKYEKNRNKKFRLIVNDTVVTHSDLKKNFHLDWSEVNSLRSRIIVAGAGGSGNAPSYVYGGHAGGLISYLGQDNTTVGYKLATQTDGYQFGTGGPGLPGQGYSGSGAGWYGGRSGTIPQTDNKCNSTTGGSSYISGHTGCVAVSSTSDSSPKAGCTTGTTDNSCSISPYGYTFTNTVMIDGAGYGWTNVKGALTPMPDPSSVGAYYASGVGHQGNGAARITQLSVYLGI